MRWRSGSQRLRIILSIILVMGSALKVISAEGVNYSVSNISNNHNYDDQNPQINDLGQVVWQGWNGHDWEIYFYDVVAGGPSRNVSNNSFDDTNPQINNRGQVVWSGWDGHDWEIYYYDVAAGGPPQNISQDDYNNYYPQINNRGQVIWDDQNEDQIYYYDIGAGGAPENISISNNKNYNTSPQINDHGQIVWVGGDSYWGSHDYDIYYYDVGVGAPPRNISQNGYDNCCPQINDLGQIVWAMNRGWITGDWNAGDFDIYYYDVGAGGLPQIVSVSGGAPQINNLNQVVWGKGGQIFYRDMGAGGPIHSIPNMAYYSMDPQINNRGQIVWVEGYYADWADSRTLEIYYYDIGVGGSPQQITNNFYCDWALQINNHGQIVWQGESECITNGYGHCNEIYLGNPTLEVRVDPTVAEYVSVVQNVIDSNYSPSNQDLNKYVYDDCKLITPKDFGLGLSFDPTEPSVILIHGWEIDDGASGWSKEEDDDLWNWGKDATWKAEDNNDNYKNDYYAIAKALHEKSDANVFIWDWTRLSDSQCWQGPPLQNESYSANKLTQALTDYFSQYSDYTAPLQFIGHSMGGKVALLAATALEDQADLHVAQVTLLDPCNTADIINPLWLNPYSITPGFILNFTDYDFYIDQYASFISREYFPLDINIPDVINWPLENCFVYGADANINLTYNNFQDNSATWEDFKYKLTALHHEALSYYLDSISDPGADAGFHWSIANPDGEGPYNLQDFAPYYYDYAGPGITVTGDNNQYYLAQTKSGSLEETSLYSYLSAAIQDESLDLKNIIYDAGQLGYQYLEPKLHDAYQQMEISAENWIANATDTVYDWTDGWWTKLKTHSPSYVYQSLTLPQDAQYLDFTYKVASADNDSYVALMIDDDLLYYSQADFKIGQEIYSGRIDISKYAGQSVSITFLVNDPDSTGGSTVYLGDMEIGEAYSYNPYEFKFTYGNGDYYTGTVYAGSDKGYYPGLRWDTVDENDQIGSYEITMVGMGSSDYASNLGQVFVDRYHDGETGSTCTPLKYVAGQAAGGSYLGSEYDYIIRSDQPDGYFGGGYYEADIASSPRPRPTPQPRSRPRPPETLGAFSQVYYQQVNYLTEEEKKL